MSKKSVSKIFLKAINEAPQSSSLLEIPVSTAKRAVAPNRKLTQASSSLKTPISVAKKVQTSSSLEIPSAQTSSSLEIPISVAKKAVAPKPKKRATSHNAFGQGNKNFNRINVNRGEGFVEETINDAKTIGDMFGKVMNSPVTNAFDKHTGLVSMAKGFGKDGDIFEGGAISRAAQNAGYIKKGADGKIESYDYKKIAKGYIGASAAARIATGGGIYKDGQGNTNVVGVPFI